MHYLTGFPAIHPMIKTCYLLYTIANEILMYIRAAKKHIGDLYLQDVVGTDREGNEVRVEDRLANDEDTIDEQVNLKLQIKHLCDVLGHVLHGREKIVIAYRYILEMTQREIATVLGISRSYVSRIEKKALSKLEKGMQGTPPKKDK